MKFSRKNAAHVLSDAQRYAINELNDKMKKGLPDTPYKECSFQNVICERGNLDFLTFSIPYGVETINKIYFRKNGVLKTDFDMSTACKITVELRASYKPYNSQTSILLVSFTIPSFDTKIVLSGEAFPIFMFPNWQFTFVVYAESAIPQPVIQDIDLIIGTIIMSKKFGITKMKTLKYLYNTPGLYKFRNQYIKDEIKIPPPNNNENLQGPSPLDGKNKKVKNENDFIKIITIDTHLDDNCACIIDNKYKNCDGGLFDTNDDKLITPDILENTLNLMDIIKKIYNPERKNDNNNLLGPQNVAHSVAEKNVPQLPHKKLDYKLNSVSDLLQIIAEVPVSEADTHSFSIDIVKLHKIKVPLEKLNSMVGLAKIKEEILDWILFFISNLPKSTNTQFMNIALYGSPGVGKTHVSEILAEILSQIGAIKNNKVAKVSAADLIGPYVGHSEMLTKNFLKANKGSVILIDEAYSIARSPSHDFCTYGVKVLDIINQFLSENTDTIMIVCGYKDLLEKYFFNANKGLNRRFPWAFTLEAYTPQELYQIMMQKIKEFNYEITITDAQTKEIIEKIKQNKDSLKSNVGDIINIISKTLSIHARKILTYTPDEIKSLNGDILVQACNNYIDGVRNNNKDTTPPDGFYM